MIVSSLVTAAILIQLQVFVSNYYVHLIKLNRIAHIYFRILTNQIFRCVNGIKSQKLAPQVHI